MSTWIILMKCYVNTYEMSSGGWLFGIACPWMMVGEWQEYEISKEIVIMRKCQCWQGTSNHLTPHCAAHFLPIISRHLVNYSPINLALEIRYTLQKKTNCLMPNSMFKSTQEADWNIESHEQGSFYPFTQGSLLHHLDIYSHYWLLQTEQGHQRDAWAQDMCY